MARTSGRPVVLLATSGTAVAEFHPAVIEAEQSRVPLVVLTADRPPELRDRGAPQTIDQERIYGRSAKWYAELPLFDGDPATEAHVRSIAGRAVATAAAGPGGSGPAQHPVPRAAPPRRAARRRRRTRRRRARACNQTRDAVRVGHRRRGRAGRGRGRGARRRCWAARPGASSSRARTTTRSCQRPSRASRGRPATRSSPTRCRAARTGPHDRSRVVTRADQLVRPGPWIEAHRPDLVIRTGAMPTSKPILQLLERARPGLS